MDSRTIGILGGGQLGRMMVEAANRLGIRTAILDPVGSPSPAGQISPLCIEGHFQDSSKVNELAAISDVMTVEIEHVNVDTLEEIEGKGMIVQPTSGTIRIIQDKYVQKQHLQANSIQVAESVEVETLEDAKEAGIRFGYPFLLKTRKLAYDGRGNALIASNLDIVSAIDKLGGLSCGLYAEQFVNFSKELAIMVVKGKSNLYTYPVVETIQENNICHIVIAPAKISEFIKRSAEEIALKTVKTFDGLGVYGVEMFLLHDESILVNEIASRPHNSGHYSIEACNISQFEAHIRAILDLPIPLPKLKVAHSAMVNVLGKSNMSSTKEIMTKAILDENASLHWYGKHESKPNRKMGHITFVADTVDSLINSLEKINIKLSPQVLSRSGPRVGIIMGSDSDLPTMKDAAKICEQFGVNFEISIVSAHRTPTRMYTYAQTAVERGLEIIIAGAGGAAHLPGMVASLTTLPVIGVPIYTQAFHGNDSLLSIVQMPTGVPVATVAIGNASNAGLLAIRILATRDSTLSTKLEEYMLKQEEDVFRKSEKLEQNGYKKYMQS